MFVSYWQKGNQHFKLSNKKQIHSTFITCEKIRKPFHNKFLDVELYLPPPSSSSPTPRNVNKKARWLYAELIKSHNSLRTKSLVRNLFVSKKLFVLGNLFALWKFYRSLIFTARKRSLELRNIFTSVCHTLYPTEGHVHGRTGTCGRWACMVVWVVCMVEVCVAGERVCGRGSVCGKRCVA